MTIRFRIPALAAVAAASALLLTACSTAATQSTATKAGDPDPGTGHLHGLGVDPADGTLYAAGHLGVFRLSPTGAVRVAGRYQDTMGFTVAGPRTFLASGHPSPTDPTATSPHLGLIRSTDAGQTWTTVSAGGEADFHSLQQAGQILYGLDSQTSQIWASKDAGATWERRARIPGGDLAAHAGAPQEVWATTRDGLLHSTDGGATFESVPGAPALAAVERPAPDQLIALAADGKVVTSGDGTSWTEFGRLPGGAQPAVLTAASPTHLLAADTNDAVYESKDGGRTWTTVHRPGHTNTGH
ncbi:F510_1955 family glycosylhydrolase [Streptomyces sp. INR7]|uniref:F510_1955 family glycosylhydrolase n=1 Tax=Streptomyces sp. INR7 TaxID=2607753 RepID=UPI00162ADA2C|nr:exo-alpha-sialidase [Streptomyces sp. INR7]QNE24110.1 exo-alpha-sialidase [Streptomyces sp. INR7]